QPPSDRLIRRVAEQPELDNRDGGDEDEDDPPDRGGLTELGSTQVAQEQVEDRRHVVRRQPPAAGDQDVRLREEPDRMYRVEYEVKEKRASHQRDRHREQALPGRGAVDDRRLFDLGIDAGQTGEIDDEPPADPLPDEKEDDDPLPEGRIVQPPDVSP